jgi:hypothetical protein
MWMFYFFSKNLKYFLCGRFLFGSFGRKILIRVVSTLSNAVLLMSMLKTWTLESCEQNRSRLHSSRFRNNLCKYDSAFLSRLLHGLSFYSTVDVETLQNLSTGLVVGVDNLSFHTFSGKVKTKLS